MIKQLLTIAFISIGLQIKAQHTEKMGYYFNPLSYNPAYAGTQNTLSVIATHRWQWSGIEGAPRTTFVSVHSPLKNHVSIGGDFSSYKIGVSTITNAYANFAYYIKINERGDRISFGLKGGINAFSIKLSELISETDPLQDDISTVKGNFGAGVHYYGKQFFVGFSALSLLQPAIWAGDTKDQKGKLYRQYYLTGGYLFHINENITLRPTAILKIEEKEDTRVKGEIAAHLFKRLWLGVTYDSNPSFQTYLQAEIMKNLNLGFGYTRYTGDRLGTYSGGTYEFMIGYQL